MLIDTHTHLYLPEFSGEDNPRGAVEAVDRALKAGVGHMVLPNVDFTTVNPLLELHDMRPQVTSIAMGLHPTEVKDSWREDLPHMLEIIGDGNGLAAIGEIGVDLYWDKTFEEQQMIVFEAQVKRAMELDFPVIIHCREALPQTLEVLQGIHGCYASSKPIGVMHSFGGSAQDVEAVRCVGDFYFGINGIVTFKNSKLRDVLPEIGLDRILLETDSPYLAPVPHRGKRNESAYLPHIAAHIASCMDLPLETVSSVTSGNASALFRISRDKIAY